MKLFVVIDAERWGYSHNVVRADSVEEACKLAGAPVPGTPSRDTMFGRKVDVEVVELEADGPAAVLWCHDESPDTGDR